MGTEKRMEMDSEIEWLGELEKTVHVKHGKKELNVKITIKLGYTEKNDRRREIMYMEANVYDRRTGKLIGKISRTAEDSTLSVVHLEVLMDFYNSVIEQISGNTTHRAKSGIDRWL
ncbi:MAG: hypothetical protein L7H07_03300 [Candidatus Nanopusillus sp.]|nr:hypothetical protein [Candidatus Nanopusillus sp.]